MSYEYYKTEFDNSFTIRAIETDGGVIFCQDSQPLSTTMYWSIADARRIAAQILAAADAAEVETAANDAAEKARKAAQNAVAA
jgi:acyl-homoserine lactone acylase PvdQ